MASSWIRARHRVLGVFVALLVDGWNTRRMERGLERQYMARLAQDVAGDVSSLRDLAATLDTKSAALLELQRLDAVGLRAHAESGALARQLVLAHSAGFGVLRGSSSTFEDLRSTGNLSLIGDPDLRALLVSYYEAWLFNAERVSARRSTFPQLVYSLLPPTAYDRNVYFDAPAAGISATLDMELAFSVLLAETGRLSLAAELNYSRFFRGVVEDLAEQAEEVATALGSS